MEKGISFTICIRFINDIANPRNNVLICFDATRVYELIPRIEMSTTKGPEQRRFYISTLQNLFQRING